MDALVMAGGEGTRLDVDGEKPLLAVDDRPMIDAVLDALDGSRIRTTIVAVSPATPRTRDHVEGRTTDIAVRTIETPGEGYVADLQYALDRVDPPVLTVSADLPLLTGPVVDDVLDVFADRDAADSLSVLVPASLKRALDVSVGETRNDGNRVLAPTGVNVVGWGDAEATAVSWDARLAVNVNRRADARVAEGLR